MQQVPNRTLTNVKLIRDFKVGSLSIDRLQKSDEISLPWLKTHRTSNYNVNMNPCENFYTYACESQYKKPDGSISGFRSLVAEAQDNVIAKLKAILEDDDFPNVYSIKIARSFYSACMDTEQIDAQGVKPIWSILKELRGWPITRKYSESDSIANWQDLHSFYGKINVFPLFEISVNNDALRRTHSILLRQPKTIIREPFLYQAKTFYKYVDYIKTVAMTVANASDSAVSEDEVTAQAKQIAAFEAELSKMLEANDRLELYKPTFLQKLQNTTNYLLRNRDYTWNWTEIINAVYHAKLVHYNDAVDIATYSYFPRLVELLHRIPMRTVVNYIHWKFVHVHLPHTSTDMRTLFFGMKNFMCEPVKNVSRWKFCGFEPSLDPVLSYAFAKKYTSAKTDKAVQRVLNDVKQATLRKIKRSFLLNEDEKRIAERKVLSMNFVLGVPEPFKNLSVVNGYYKKLTISKNYFDSVLTLRKFFKIKELDVIVDGKRTFSANNNFLRIATISSLGSAYEFFDNRVLIKAENLMPPLFDADYPEYKKYGILGFIIAYEIMHAFNDADSIGGTKSRGDLYSEETKLKYWNKMECFINQYDNYYIPDPFDSQKHVYVDGDRSAMENMADSAAIQISFQAFLDRARKLGVSSLEDDEDFFASFAALLCRPELEEFYLSRFNLALRTLPRFRVIGSLSNTNEFAKTFSCSSGARMNPEIKCNFWN
ncbi:neprilysin-like isoform X2 [Phymastichus coffea]|uniref:neprilysin-like isoform X2 n=1 Tax=Phymastichus coffea TaxID=108790 RepID=UPI00273CE2A4|nr:neprilysin-like isoform X2 [Phymastichus coffea]